MKVTLLAIFALLCTTFVYAEDPDECATVASTYGRSGFGADFKDEPSYNCTSRMINKDYDLQANVRKPFKMWTEWDKNCGCTAVDHGWSETRNHTDSHTANLSLAAKYQMASCVKAGGSIPGLCKGEASATVTWELGGEVTWGSTVSDGDSRTVVFSPQGPRCSEYYYHKYYWEYNIDGTEDLEIEWEVMAPPIEPWETPIPTGAIEVIPDAITSFASGIGPAVVDTDPGNGYPIVNNEAVSGWCPINVRCTKCNSFSKCYTADPEDPDCQDLCPCATPTPIPE